jgi:hypothetical protein
MKVRYAGTDADAVRAIIRDRLRQRLSAPKRSLYLQQRTWFVGGDGKARSHVRLEAKL